MLTQTLKSRWFTSVLHAGLWLLLALAVLRLRGTSPHFLETTSHTSPAQSQPVARLENLYARSWPKPTGETNSPSPFATPYHSPRRAAATRKVNDLSGFLPDGRGPGTCFSGG